MNPENQPAPVAPMNQPMNAPRQPQEHKKVGPIITVLVIVLILIIAALYFFAVKINQQGTTDGMTAADSDASSSAQDQTVQPVTNQSDDVNSMNADLNTSTKGLDSQNF